MHEDIGNRPQFSAKLARSQRPPAPTALVYARVSSDEQAKGYSLPTQLEACRQYAADRGYQVLGEFVDDYSGTESERPGLAALYDALRETGAGVVIVYDVDRLGRGVTVLAIVEHTVERLGAKVEFVRGSEYQGAEGELLRMIKSALSGYENAQRVERSRRGARGRVKAGHPLIVGGKAPYGYRYEGGRHVGRLEPDPAEAEVVRLMFRWLIEDRCSTHEICRRLTQMRVPTRGDTCLPVKKRAGFGVWNPATVYQMLTNRLYVGEYHYGGTRRQKRGGRVVQVPTPDEEVTTRVPPIIDEATWQRAQAQLRENAKLARRNRKYDYLLAGLITCPPPCGRLWTGQSNGHSHYYRVCRTVVPTHRHFHLPADLVEGAVWRWVCETLLDPDRVARELERQAAERHREVERHRERLAAVDAALADLDRKLSTLLAKELDGYPGELIAGHRAALLAQRRELAAERDRLAAGPPPAPSPDTVRALLARVGELAGRLPQLTFAERRRLLLDLQIRVTVESREQVRVQGTLGPATVRLAPAPLVRALARVWQPDTPPDATTDGAAPPCQNTATGPDPGDAIAPSLAAS